MSEINKEHNQTSTGLKIQAYIDRVERLEEDKKAIMEDIKEVFGEANKKSFTENSKYDPRSPYSATKASSDHLVRAWGRTLGLPILITNCSNNYGPFHFPEKLIPPMILNALQG